jgi:hypothetical protein
MIDPHAYSKNSSNYHNKTFVEITIHNTAHSPLYHCKYKFIVYSNLYSVNSSSVYLVACMHIVSSCILS